MHYKPGKRRLAPYIFVDDREIELFKEISEMKIELEGREVPAATNNENKCKKCGLKEQCCDEKLLKNLLKAN